MQIPSITQSLFWKDAHTLRPLAIAIAVGIVLFNLLGCLGMLLHGEPINMELHVMIWILMPNLMALGAPAMLVGGEEETGTLGWLRTLPVSWRPIVDTKLMVAMIGLIGAWIMASIVVFLFWQIAPNHAATHAESLSFWGIVQLSFFSCSLLLVGFVMAYTFKSPIAALFSLLLIVPIFSYLSNIAAAWFLTGRQSLQWWDHESIETWKWVAVAVAAFALLGGLTLLQRMLGKRRLTTPARKRRTVVIAETAPSAYRPPMSIGLERPSVTRALHWQQFRQIGLPVLGLTLTGLIAALGLAFTQRGTAFGNGTFASTFEAFAPMVMVLSSLWLGSLVFYGDSIRRRCAFFADRGISPSRVWWSRISLPMAGCLLIVAVKLLTWPSDPRFEGFWIVSLLCFAFGQLASQWMSRPVLSFFAGPAYAAVCAMIIAYLFHWAQIDQFWLTLLLVPVLLASSWWLCDRWLKGNINLGYHWRAIAFSAIGICLPIIAVAGYRLATMPAWDTQWRAQAMAESDKIAQVTTPGLPKRSFQIGQSVSMDVNSIWRLGRPEEPLNPVSIDDEFGESIEKELEGQALMGDFVSVDTLIRVLNPNADFGDATREEINQARRDILKVAISWVRRSHEAAKSGNVPLYWYQRMERLENAIISLLETKSYGDSSEVGSVVAALSDDETRKEARRTALLLEWRQYQDARDNPNPMMQRRPGFMTKYLHSGGLFGINDSRSDRYLDAFVRTLLRQLDSGLPSYDSVEFTERLNLWTQAHSPRERRYRRTDICLEWTSDYQKRLDRLRRKYPPQDSSSQEEQEKPTPEDSDSDD